SAHIPDQRHRHHRPRRGRRGHDGVGRGQRLGRIDHLHGDQLGHFPGLQCDGLLLDQLALRVVPAGQPQALDVLHAVDMQHRGDQLTVAHCAAERPAAAGRPVGWQRRQVA
ncbi:MAG: hypothetical protein ACK55I_11530, partial [bacterium]